MRPLVSIIIPTYNRQHIISETLDSIIKQTYTNFECLIIDDRSTDTTEAFLLDYHKMDNRFLFFKRPDAKIKGANTCRNIGLEQSKGDYIIFFDSDDLMTPNHIEVKVQAILQHQCDYVITRTQFFNYPEGNILLNANYDFQTIDISAYNYISQQINWLTLDVCIKAKIAKSLLFNETLQAGQEYNYFSKLLLTTINAVFLDNIVSLRRHQKSSIRGDLRGNKLASYFSFYNTYWHTYLDTKAEASKHIRNYLVYKCVMLAYKLPKPSINNRRSLLKAVFRELCVKAYYHAIKLYFNPIKNSTAT